MTKPFIAALLSLALLTSCATSQLPPTTSDASTSNAKITSDANFNSTLWLQTAAEYRANARQTYNSARQNIQPAIDDREWTAALEQSGDYRQLPPAVVLDIDETVLDNSPFQARLVLEGGHWNPELWDAWVAQRAARAVPGAVDFLNDLPAHNVTVILISNRECSPRPGNSDPCPQKADTLANLQQVGITHISAEQILLKNEQPGWGSEKRSRRLVVAGQYRIVMLLGDDLGDFLADVKKGTSVAERGQRVAEQSQRWGRQWFMLANPSYGSWLSVVPEPKSDSLISF
ncbi:5'-nucleotidase, lipoprotein e(P4) family [Halioxenophilus sp. WMMB6]|uniref:5'-nucleotidase, lipoprotein e(P4) family n=1 Tax=Halioxenophilus sp. WMMB6 TaxID=3073815 RepID=UPI00295EE501|nr:HAD family acid phosphatase [Halioxenophilus sp. WMMB6]